MKKLTFSIDIKAPKEKVWYSLWDDDNYENWTTAFCEGSFTISDWKEGSKIYFLDPNGSGMSSKVSIHKPFDTMSFNHIGELKHFKELPLTEETKSWSGSEERYDLTENNGITTVTASVDIVEKFADYFNGTFPKALQKVKEIAESDVQSIMVRTATNKSLENVWDYFTNPKHIVNWNNASDDWHCPKAENNLKVGSGFNFTMASKDGKMSFDFKGIYSEIVPLKKIVYNIEDGRKVTIKFAVMDATVIVTESFEPENVNSVALQRQGWQNILDNFKKYIEQ